MRSLGEIESLTLDVLDYCDVVLEDRGSLVELDVVLGLLSARERFV